MVRAGRRGREGRWSEVGRRRLVAAMATQLSLLGTVDSSVQHALTVNRLTGASQLAVPYETTETVWERGAPLLPLPSFTR